MEGEPKPKKERPQNRNLIPLGSGNLTPEEELEIRRKGNRASQKARTRNASIRNAIRQEANMRTRGKGKSLDLGKITSIEDIDGDDTPQIVRLVHSYWVMAINGDREARDWLVKYGALSDREIPDEMQGGGLTVTADADALEQPGGVRIHLIRGEKPHEELSEEEMATRAADRLAVVEAMKAIGEYAAQSEKTEDVTPDE